MLDIYTVTGIKERESEILFGRVTKKPPKRPKQIEIAEREHSRCKKRRGQVPRKESVRERE